jgi:hypothetical protein
MKRTRHRRVPSDRRRALQIIAANFNGCTEAMLAAHDIPAEVLIELVRGGLVVARSEHINEEDSFFEVTRVWITEAGERLLAARTSGTGHLERSGKAMLASVLRQGRPSLKINEHLDYWRHGLPGVAPV